LRGGIMRPVPDRNVHRFRVRYAECDPQGVVFNAHYLAYFDLGITELWRAALGSYGAMLDRGDDLVVVEATVRYRRPARFDDRVELETVVSHLGSTSLAVANHLRDAVTRESLAEGEVAYVCVDRAGAKQPLPEYLRAALAAGVAAPPGG